MSILCVNGKKCDLCNQCVQSCPFNGIDIIDGKVEFNTSCKMCSICMKNCPNNAITLIDGKRSPVDKKGWKGVMVYVEHVEGVIHPVTIELIGKARQLAEKVNHPVYCVLIGSNISDRTVSLLKYGVDRVFVYDCEQLKHFKVDIYANVFEDAVRKVKPCIVLIGATSIGRSLAPRLSTRFRTGLTADCTSLDIRPDTDLVQIRPAFGGNILAQIATPNSRPQFATVRYKVMDPAQPVKKPSGMVEACTPDNLRLNSKISIQKVIMKEKLPAITDAEVLVVAGI